MSGTAALTPAAARTIAPHLFPAREPLTPAQIKAGIEAALRVQRLAVTMSKRPFGAVLLGPDNSTVLLSHSSVSQVFHAESSLAQMASLHYSKEFLWQCTLVSTWEPCAMCSSTIYWAHIGGVVYAASNEQLVVLTGPGNKENFTLTWECRTVLGGQQKVVEVVGPVEGMDRVVMEESDLYWATTRVKSE